MNTAVMIHFNVRKAQLNDVMHFQEAISMHLNKPWNVMEFDEFYKKKLKDKEYTFLIMVDDEKKVAGGVILQYRQTFLDKSPFLEIQTFFVTPKYRKLNAADFLYQAIAETASEKKVFKLQVGCYINSTLNQNFYTKRGFKVHKKLYTKDLY
ncbi:MAG: GNAT family N-acetyltransferase [Chitinophagia bacterium]